MLTFKIDLFNTYFKQAEELYIKLQSKDYCMSLANESKIRSSFQQVLQLLEKANRNLHDLQTNEAEFSKLRADMVIYKKMIILRSQNKALV